MQKIILKSCFISAPVRTDTSSLRRALEARGVSWSDAVAARPGSSILDTIESAMQRSDFVCVVLPAGPENGNVLFEMGLARGLKKALLVLAEERNPIPSDVQGVAYARTRLDDEKAVNFHLDTFLRHADKGPSRSVSARRRQSRRVDVTWARRSLRELASQAPGHPGVAFEQLVARLLESAGAVVSKGGEKEMWADMAVWIDDLQGAIGNPLIVEVKSGRITERRLREAERHMAEFLPKVHARAGLLVYHDADNKNLESTSPTWPLVFRFTVRELIELVATNRLAAEVIRKRNELVHALR
jgi:hypothetical protein